MGHRGKREGMDMAPPAKQHGHQGVREEQPWFKIIVIARLGEPPIQQHRNFHLVQFMQHFPEAKKKSAPIVLTAVADPQAMISFGIMPQEPH